MLFPRSFSSLLPFAPPFPRVPSHTSQYFLPAARVLCPVRQCAVQFSPAAPIQQPELAQPKAAKPSKTKVTPFPFPFPQCHPSSLPPPVAVDRRVPGFPAKTSAKGALLPHNHSPIVKRLLGPPPYVSLPLLFPIQISHPNPHPIQTTLSQYTHTTSLCAPYLPRIPQHPLNLSKTRSETTCLRQQPSVARPARSRRSAARRTPTPPSVASPPTCSSPTSSVRTSVRRTPVSRSDRSARSSVSAGRPSTTSSAPRTRPRLPPTRSATRTRSRPTTPTRRRMSLLRVFVVSVVSRAAAFNGGMAHYGLSLNGFGAGKALECYSSVTTSGNGATMK